MKQLIIYIEIHKERPFSFENNILHTIKKKYPTHLILDLDNFSSSELFKHTIQACIESKKIMLIVNSKEENAALGQVLHFINRTLRNTDIVIESILLGENSIAEKMLSRTSKLCKQKEENLTF